MIYFVLTLGGLSVATILFQLIVNMRIVGGNELGVVSGSGGKKGFRTLSGGRAFIITLLQSFSKFDLTPVTIEVEVDSAIAAGIVPLNVKATVSFAIASNEAGRSHAVTRILSLSRNQKDLRRVANDIIEGHLRDSIASMTPEQVMKDKDTLVAKMINVCKSDLENIGLEITTMNIADVDDHRLPGVEEPDLYMALLKRIQSANAETKARQAQADARAASAEQSHARRAETEVQNLHNELARLKADVRVQLAELQQKKTVGVEQESANARARVSGIRGELKAEVENIAMLKNRYRAEIITPALGRSEQLVLEAAAEMSEWKAVADAENSELKVTLETLQGAGSEARRAWVIDNLDAVFTPFARTLSGYPADHISVLTGAGGDRQPISAIHPHAVTAARNDMLAAALTGIGTKQQKATGAAGTTGTTGAAGAAATGAADTTAAADPAAANETSASSE